MEIEVVISFIGVMALICYVVSLHSKVNDLNEKCEKLRCSGESLEKLVNMKNAEARMDFSAVFARLKKIEAEINYFKNRCTHKG